MEGKPKSWAIVLICAGFAVGGLIGMLALLSTARVQASVEPPYVEVSSAGQVTTIPTPTLPSSIKLLAPAFMVTDTGHAMTLTLHLPDLPPKARLLYRRNSDDKWQRVAIYDGFTRWQVPDVSSGEYVIVVGTAQALPSNAIVVDDRDTGFLKHGPSQYWHPVTGTAYYQNYAYWTWSVPMVENHAEWTPTIRLNGPYEVQVFVPGNYATTTQAIYNIHYAGQITQSIVDQSIYTAEWVSLGMYTFALTTAGYVELTDATNETLSHRIGFDAVAFIPLVSRVYLPLVVRNYPPPHLIKSRTGIHLGSHPKPEDDDWPESVLIKINGDPEVGGIWPRSIVVLSEQLYYLDRPTDDGQCLIAQARVRSERLYAYLTEAQRQGVKIIIRISPSPGNFQDWQDTALDHILLSGTFPAGENYCDFKYGQFRAIDDVAQEIYEIYKLNVNQRDWSPESFFFIPANEPNKEWYSDWKHDPEAQDRIRFMSAWVQMDSYFAAIYGLVKNWDDNIQVLPPPMSQGLYAETRYFGTCKLMALDDGFSGYDHMALTFTRSDGYVWHNYWDAGKEIWDNDPCPSEDSIPSSYHVFQSFPQSLQDEIKASAKPAFIAEADLLSPCQRGGNLITDKDAQPEATRNSLWEFVTEEQGADYVIAWLLTEYPYSLVKECPADANLTNYEEIRWHQAYENNVERVWFSPWWSLAK